MTTKIQKVGGQIQRSPGWFTSSFPVGAGRISSDFRDKDDAIKHLNKRGYGKDIKYTTWAPDPIDVQIKRNS